jgi:hypothetical protein
MEACVMQSAETVVEVLRARGRRGLPCERLYRNATGFRGKATRDLTAS